MPATITIIFVLACIIQLVYFLTWLVAFTGYRKTDGSPQPASIVVAAKNELNNLQKLIPQLQAQSHPAFEIIIVNDRSSDDTYDYLLELQSLHSNLKMVNVEHKPEQMDGKKYAITLGIKAAKFEHIVLTDADCEITSTGWLAKMSAPFENNSTSLVLGASIYTGGKGFLGAFARFESFYTALQYLGFALAGMPYMGVGRNLAYRKKLFTDNKGFNEYMSVTGGDDDLFVNKHAKAGNCQVVLEEDALTYSHPKKSWRSFFRQKTRHLSVGKRYKFKHKLLLGLLHLSHFTFWAAFVAALILSDNYYIIGAAWVIRTFILYLTFNKAGAKIGVSNVPLTLVLLDFIFVFYYLSTGLRAIFTKKVRWS